MAFNEDARRIIICTARMMLIAAMKKKPIMYLASGSVTAFVKQSTISIRIRIHTSLKVSSVFQKGELYGLNY